MTLQPSKSRGRPSGEVHLAMLRAAAALRIERAQSGQGATLLEIVQRSQVGYAVARSTLRNMVAHGHLHVVGQRRVEYRNRPVLEYAPAVQHKPDDAVPSSVEEGPRRLEAFWVRRVTAHE